MGGGVFPSYVWCEGPGQLKISIHAQCLDQWIIHNNIGSNISEVGLVVLGGIQHMHGQRAGARINMALYVAYITTAFTAGRYRLSS